MLLLLLGALAGVGCGGSSSSSSETSSTPGSSGSPSQTEASSGFVRPGGKNKVAEFGQEANALEREAASTVLEESLQARAAGNWAAQCISLTASVIKRLEEEAPALGAEGGCPKSLEAQAQPLAESRAIRANTMTGPIATLRVEGSNAYALYHGAGGVDYAMPMKKEGGVWKVASLVTQEIP